MSLRGLLIAPLLSFVMAAPAWAGDGLAGMDRLDMKLPHRGQAVAAAIWYPAAGPTYRGLVGDNPVFRGTRVHIGPPIAAGKHPLILFSHGSGGNMDNAAWLFATLAEQGAMVLAVNHPGTTSGDSSPRRSVRLDERARDVSAALDVLLQEAPFAAHIDPKRIVSLGFSLGGATALGLAGMRFDREAYHRFCDRSDDLPVDCQFFAKGGVDLANLPDGFAADTKDGRVSSAIAVDPGFSYAARPNSIAAMTMPVLLINLGADGHGSGHRDRFLAADVGPNGSNLVGRLSDVTYREIGPANHFTFLAECKPEGAALLAEEQDDPVCTDPAGTDRADVHRRIARTILEFLKLPGAE